MKRRRHDSDSEDEGQLSKPDTLPAQQASASTIDMSTASAHKESNEIVGGALETFTGGTLFSKGKRTQLAADLATRVENGEFTSNAVIMRTPLGQHESSQPVDLLKQLEGDITSSRDFKDDNDLDSGSQILPLTASNTPNETQQNSRQREKPSIALSSIRSYLLKGFRPVMNCRIQDDEVGRSGVWLPPSTLIASNTSFETKHTKSAEDGSGQNPVGSSLGSTTMLGVKLLNSARLQPQLPVTFASSGPIPLNILRSLKGPPVPADEKDADEEPVAPTENTNAEPVRFKGQRREDNNKFGLSNEGNDNNNNNQASPEPISHLDVGGGGLQHPFFNSYCSTVLQKVAVAFDVVSDNTNAPHTSFDRIPKEESLTPVLTVLSHSLTFKDIQAVYCGGTATKTLGGDNGKEGGFDVLLAHSASTKPHEYALPSHLGSGSTRSGWRWDGIVRGNPRVLAAYKLEERY